MAKDKPPVGRYEPAVADRHFSAAATSARNHADLSCVPQNDRSKLRKSVERADQDGGTAAMRYMTDIVEPTINDFAANPRSVRHAFLACVVTFHCIDYLAATKLRKKFRDESPEFYKIDRVAHAFKHVETRGESQRDPSTKATDVVTRPAAIPGVMRPGLSRPGDSEGGVTILTDTDVDLLQTVKRTAQFLRSKCRN
jgi:hypothetical protein